jgi:plasmid stabilization system protein ParE
VTSWPVRFLGAARAELRRAVDRYDAQVPGLGDEFADEVKHSVRSIVANPESGSPYLAGTRRMLVRRFPFAVVYRADEQQIVVVALAHHRRRPDYWTRRQ